MFRGMEKPGRHCTTMVTPENWGRVGGSRTSSDSVLGTDGLWIRMRFLVENSGNSSYTVAQFGRSTSAATDNVFESEQH